MENGIVYYFGRMIGGMEFVKCRNEEERREQGVGRKGRNKPNLNLETNGCRIIISPFLNHERGPREGQMERIEGNSS
jgi:hypothetical protein